MPRFAETIAGLAGWRRALFAFAAGALSTLALPPFGFWPALFIGVPALLLLIEGAGNWRRAAVAGWWWGYGHFVTGVYWIGIALLVDPERFAWLLPFASLGLPMIFALFPAFAAVLARVFGRGGPALLVALAGAWIVGEIARDHVLSGFPWNPLAAAWIEVPAAAQGASLAGAFGLGGLTVLFCGLPYLFLRVGWERLAVAAVVIALASGIFIYGQTRVPEGLAPRADPKVRIRLVQGNIDQRLKHDDAARATHFRRHMDLSRAPSADGVAPKLIIWPETALPYTLDAAPQLPRILGSLVGEDGVALIGAVRLRQDERGLKAWNSLHALRHDGGLVGTYDKHHLVPFGEYLPLRGVLGLFGLDKLAVGAVDFSAGPGPRGIDLPGIGRVLPLICYEAIFPEAAEDPDARPALLVNVTNDAWFGTSNGPPQHLAAARLRAVEQGLPLARAANTGISALVDPYGRVEQALPLGVAGVIDGDMPAAAAPTLFAQWGALVPASLAFIMLLLGFAGRSRSP